VNNEALMVAQGGRRDGCQGHHRRRDRRPDRPAHVAAGPGRSLERVRERDGQRSDDSRDIAGHDPGVLCGRHHTGRHSLGRLAVQRTGLSSSRHGI
jgi:hypothetical protein